MEIPQLTRSQLVSRIMAECVREEEFLLKSDVISPFFIDKYKMLTQPVFLRGIVALMLELVPFNVTRLAGIKTGAVPLVTALSWETGLPFVILRDADPGSPKKTLIEGEIHSKDRVLLVDDIISTGRRVLEMARFLEVLGVKVAKICAILDREHQAQFMLKDYGFILETLFTSSELGMRG